jgi:ABC-2 type transport system ATP-binding protein
MNILTGYLSASAGRVSVDGIDMLQDPIGAKKLIGYLPEQPPVYPDMTVEEYLNFNYDLKGCTFDREAHIAEICEVTKISDVRKRLIGNLSKGYRQRVGVAQALIGDPPVIIFDEPTVGLDPKQILEVRNLLRTLAKRHTVILSTHILAEVQAVCERVIIINKGELIADERTDNLTKAIEDGYHYEIKIVGPQKDVKAKLSAAVGVKKVTATGQKDADAYCYEVESEGGFDVRKTLFSICAANSWPILGLMPIGTDLESVFIKLVERSEGTADGRDATAKRKAH